jgi:hypothetical protein
MKRRKPGIAAALKFFNAALNEVNHRARRGGAMTPLDYNAAARE